jgi:hypothetical protein
MKRGSAVVMALMTAALALPSAGMAQQGPLAPLNDLGALGEGTGQTPDRVPTAKRPEPPFVATPQAKCGPGSRPEPGVQGRVPAGSATNGLFCNLTVVSHQGNSGGFKVMRYVDQQGHDCAFYDTALLFPINAFKFDTNSAGVAVLDMSDPAHPKQTDTLTEPPMLSPHESLNLNPKRGLLAAVLGNPTTYPGLVSIYDAHADCRHPVLKSTRQVARLGHESGFSVDGKTFYATGTATKAITGIDVTDPANPRAVWQGNVASHGMTLSDDGNRAYITDPGDHSMLILDTSEVQARKANPQTREISRLTWRAASIPQNAIPFTKDGKPYVLEIDEYDASTLGNGGPDEVGAARIIDVSDERTPSVVANLRLQVDQPAEHREAAGDPGGNGSPQGYAAHYCNIPTEVNPTIVACSFITSGLRVFDISNLAAPVEVAYFVAPTKATADNAFKPSDFAMSKPAFVPERREIWYTDGPTGFYAVRVADSVWPQAGPAAAPPARKCAGRRTFTATVRVPRGAKVRSARVTLGGKRQHFTRAGRAVRVRVNLRGFRRSSVALVFRVRLRGGRTVVSRRLYHPCTRRGGAGR